MAEIENLKIGNGTIHIVGNQDIVADSWEAGKTYVADRSYVIREHILYVCNTTHTSVSPFDPTKWTATTIGEALGMAGSANVIECTQAEYTAWKAGGLLINETTYILKDAPNLNATANDLSMGSAPYASGTVGEAITEATGTTASQTITYDSVNFKFRRTQYYVEISLSHGSSKTFPTTWTSIGTLQADLRPTTTNFVFVGFPNGYNMMFRINKDTGNVDIMANSADSMYAQGTGMFMI